MAKGRNIKGQASYTQKTTTSYTTPTIHTENCNFIHNTYDTHRKLQLLTTLRYTQKTTISYTTPTIHTENCNFLHNTTIHTENYNFLHNTYDTHRKLQLLTQHLRYTQKTTTSYTTPTIHKFSMKSKFSVNLHDMTRLCNFWSLRVSVGSKQIF